MKRFFSVLLTVCMISACCVFFTSCNSVTEKDVLSDPYSVINEAAENTLSAFFTDDAGVSKAIIGMVPKGELSVSFESDDAGGMPLSISEKIYYDLTDRSYVFDTAYAYDDVDMSFRFYSDKQNFALSGKDILGSDKTILVNFDSFIDRFDKSEFVKQFGLDKATVDEIVEGVKELKEGLNSDLANDEEKAIELNKAIYSLLLNQVTEEKITNDGGKDIKCIVAEFTINNENIGNVFNKAEEYKESEEFVDEDAANDFNDLWEDLSKEVDIQLSVKVFLNKRTNEFAKVEFDGTLTGNYDKENPVVLDGEVLFGETEISLALTVETDEEPLYITAKLTKDVSSEKAEYKFAVDAVFEGDNLNVLDITYNYEKSSGDIALTIDFYEDGKNCDTAKLDGNLSVSKEKISLVFDSLKINEETNEFRFELALSAVDAIPEIPEDAKDFVDIGYVGWSEIIEEFMSSELGKLLYGDLDSEF